MATLVELREAYNGAVTRMQEAADAIAGAGDDADLNALDESLDTADAEVKRCKQNLDRAERVERARAVEPLHIERSPERIIVGTEEVEYRRDKGGFFRDLAHAREGDTQARERLERHNAQADDHAKRAGLTQTATAGGEFVPPIWLNEIYAPLLRAGRPFVNAVGTNPLPPGTNSINLPKITTGASTAAQTDTNSVSNTDLVTTSVTAAVQTVAGRTVSSYQVIDMGQPEMEQVIYDDLIRSYAAKFDALCVNGAVSNAKGILGVTGINAVTYTDASPTVPEIYPFIFQGKSQVEGNAFTGVDFAFSHPSFWNWYLSALDSSNRPLALSTNASMYNAVGTFDPTAAQGFAGNIAGIPYLNDANVPVNLGGGTNETRLVLLNRQGYNIWESAPRFKVADQTSITTLQYQFVLYGYYAVMSRQAKMISALSGTGLIVQSGF